MSGSSAPQTQFIRGGGGLAPRKIVEFSHTYWDNQHAAACESPGLKEHMMAMKRIWYIPPGVWVRFPEGIRRDVRRHGEASDPDDSTDTDTDMESESSEDDVEDAEGGREDAGDNVAEKEV
ncbi:hypothetical protein DFP72DRAFT_1075074 [Ephemerocybe angulata]|uniref:Uncharacterized protein n=1 Tax=Ephemerocybe angulata TaxID=980116 RepID=A0A8H6LXG4_9AGAR|nr:hypothetical protein DFP72DRAFT_1075074 [Tulosesus angulatus]